MAVAIVGGGIAGLAAAYELAARDVRFVLLEASDRVGGLIRTERVGGFTIDAGADSILAQKPAGIRLCEELGLGRRLIAQRPPRTAYVHARGHLHRLPSPSVFGIPTTWPGLASYSLLPWPARLQVALAQLRLRITRPGSDPSRADATRADESVASFYRRRFGPATVDLIAQPLLGGIHAGDVERLSIQSVAPRLLDPGLFTLRWQSPPSTQPDGLFRALEGGMGELVDAIALRLPDGSIRLRSAATSLVATPATDARNKWQIRYDRGVVDADAVIIAAPAHAAATLCAEIDPELAALCRDVPYVSTASVALAWPRANVAHPLDGSGFVVARQHSALRITAATWVSSKWEHRAPEGMVLLRAFLGSASDPAAVDADDRELIGIAVRDLSAVLDITGAPAFARVQRWIRAGAQHEVGQLSRVARIEARLAGLPGLFVAGSGFRAVGVPDCIADGRSAATAAARYVKMQE
jgi:oxygen-dependent protoporphyrinogen oxidase